MSDHRQEISWRSDCPISCALDVLGDKWSLLVIRDLMLNGHCTYSDFRSSAEGISTNILADRLKLLTAAGIIERSDPAKPARNNAYRLTAKGEGLRPILEGLAGWAQRNLDELNPTMMKVI